MNNTSNTITFHEKPSTATKDFVQWENTWSRLLLEDTSLIWLEWKKWFWALRLHSLWQWSKRLASEALTLEPWIKTIYGYSNKQLSLSIKGKWYDFWTIHHPWWTFFRIPWGILEWDLKVSWEEWFVFELDWIDETLSYVYSQYLPSSVRTKYIDWCKQCSILQNTKKWLPNMNMLFFPKNINQTQHTHPSQRIGIIKEGHGECITAEDIIPLIKGNLFMIMTDPNSKTPITEENKYTKSWVHSFRTTDSEMTVIAGHGDSSTWPTDEHNAILNNTMINGAWANDEINEHLRTK